MPKTELSGDKEYKEMLSELPHIVNCDKHGDLHTNKERTKMYKHAS